MAVTNIYNLTLIPVGLLMISRIYRAGGNGVCGDSNDKKTINKMSTVGSSVKLSCNVTNLQFVAWTVVNKESTVKIITFGKTTFSKPHYSIPSFSESNTTPSTESFFMYNLLINNFTEDQQGLYTCHDQGCNKAQIVLFVESGQRGKQPPEEQQNAHLSLIWSLWIILFVSGVIIITAITVTAVSCYRKIRSLLSLTSPYSLDGNESKRRFPLSIYRKPPSLSRHQFVDTSDKKYEKYIPQEEMTRNDFSPARATTKSTEMTAKEAEEDYLQILE